MYFCNTVIETVMACKILSIDAIARLSIVGKMRYSYECDSFAESLDIFGFPTNSNHAKKFDFNSVAADTQKVAYFGSNLNRR